MAEHESTCATVIAKCRENGTIPTRTMCLTRIEGKGKDRKKKAAQRHAKEAIGNQPTTATATRDLARAVPALRSIRSRFGDENVEEKVRSMWAADIAAIKAELDRFEGRKHRELCTGPVAAIKEFVSLKDIAAHWARVPTVTQADIAGLLDDVDETLAAIREAIGGARIVPFNSAYDGETQDDTEEAGE